jgi:predicted negative regulator of RcsB-dependent stress response
MLEFLKRRLKSEKGAMDKIIVTLLLVIVGVGAVVGLQSWVSGQKNSLQTSAASVINSTVTDAKGNN